MATIDQSLLNLESELKGMIDQTAALKQQVGDYSKAREDLMATRSGLAKAIQSLDTVLRKEQELLVAIRESMPDKVIDQLSKFNALSEDLKKEIVDLEDEFITAKDVMLSAFGETETKLHDQNENNKSAIIKSVAELYEKYQFMSEKVHLADEKIIVSQDRMFDNFKRIEDGQEKSSKQVSDVVAKTSNQLGTSVEALQRVSQRNFIVMITLIVVNIAIVGYLVFNLLLKK